MWLFEVVCIKVFEITPFKMRPPNRQNIIWVTPRKIKFENVIENHEALTNGSFYECVIDYASSINCIVSLFTQQGTFSRSHMRSMGKPMIEGHHVICSKLFLSTGRNKLSPLRTSKLAYLITSSSLYVWISPPIYVPYVIVITSV